jgi:hypothetical protein
MVLSLYHTIQAQTIEAHNRSVDNHLYIRAEMWDNMACAETEPTGNERFHTDGLQK